MSNALKYTQKGGFVKIIIDFFFKKINEELSEKYIRILVWDNGLGISPENQKKLF
jgi:signal transduction histidine kinase